MFLHMAGDLLARPLFTRRITIIMREGKLDWNIKDIAGL
jgi:hypothetical protein